MAYVGGERHRPSPNLLLNSSTKPKAKAHPGCVAKPYYPGGAPFSCCYYYCGGYVYVVQDYRRMYPAYVLLYRAAVE